MLSFSLQQIKKFIGTEGLWVMKAIIKYIRNGLIVTDPPYTNSTPLQNLEIFPHLSFNCFNMGAFKGSWCFLIPSV